MDLKCKTNGNDNKNSKTQEEPNKEVVAPICSDLKHPLASTWTVWYYLNDKRLKWEENQVVVCSFSTIEDFWACFNYLEPASKIKLGSDLSVFKEGIRPMWEDPANISGGRWSHALQKNQRAVDLDVMWMELLIMMVSGEHSEKVYEEITGAVVSLRPRGDRIALWTGDSRKEFLCKEAGKLAKLALGLHPRTPIDYNLHSDTSNKRSSSVRALYVA